MIGTAWALTVLLLSVHIQALHSLTIEQEGSLSKLALTDSRESTTPGRKLQAARRTVRKRASGTVSAAEEKPDLGQLIQASLLTPNETTTLTSFVNQTNTLTSDTNGTIALTSDIPQFKGGISRILHQSWQTRDLPARFKHWQQSWKDLNPGWEYRLWTYEDNHNLVAR